MKAEEFRAILKRLGLTQAEAARELGFTRATVCRWFHGMQPINRGNSALVREILLQQGNHSRRTVTA